MVFDNYVLVVHYSDAEWASWRRKSPVTRLPVQQMVQVKISQLHITVLKWGNRTVTEFGHLESTTETLVFDILIYWKWPGTNHKQVLDFNATLTFSAVDEICNLQLEMNDAK